MEVLVEQYLDEMLEKDTEENRIVRQSPKMRMQVMAHSLNSIPPFYVTGKVGEVYGFSSASLPQNKTDIMIEIAKAIEITVKKGYN